jgi:hypothetical protein
MVKSSADREYEVGYCRPPKDACWKPGQSGNPSGKKKGCLNVKTMFQHAATKVGKFAMFGRSRKMTLWEAFTTSVIQRAQNGDVFFIDVMVRLQEAFPGSEMPSGYRVVRDRNRTRVIYPISREEHAEMEEAIEAIRNLDPRFPLAPKDEEQEDFDEG